MWTEAEKAIYTCPITQRKYDPLAVRRALVLASKNTFNAVVSRVRSQDAIEHETAMGELIAIGRKALDLPAVDVNTGAGWLDSQVYDAILAFTGFLRKKGLRAQSTPSTAPCTDCPGA